MFYFVFQIFFSDDDVWFWPNIDSTHSFKHYSPLSISTYPVSLWCIGFLISDTWSFTHPTGLAKDFFHDQFGVSVFLSVMEFYLFVCFLVSQFEIILSHLLFSLNSSSGITFARNQVHLPATESTATSFSP